MENPAARQPDPDLRARVRAVAEAYRAADAAMAEERGRALAELPDAVLLRHFEELLDLGVAQLPRTPEEWAAFDAGERELVTFQRHAMLVAERMGLGPWKRRGDVEPGSKGGTS